MYFYLTTNIYQQMLWFLHRQQKSRKQDVEIIFATPVYGLDGFLIEQYTQLHLISRQKKEEQTRREKVNEALKNAWKAKEGKQKGMNFQNLLKQIRNRLVLLGEWHVTRLIRNQASYTAVGKTIIKGSI